MRLFISAGEPSGDLHGGNLIRALRERNPSWEFVGFGGDQMESAGCRLLYPLCRLAVMWFLRVLLNARTFLRLLSDAERYFRDERPDALILIDYPGFNFRLAKLAHERGIPVYWFVPPQLWAWAGWRVRKMQKWVDHLLCSLPFEPGWYAKHGVESHYLGHPYFDALAVQPIDDPFVSHQQRQGGPIVAILPGSRDQEIERNLGMMLAAAEGIQQARPDVRFLVACLRPDQRERVLKEVGRRPGLPIEVHAGKTAEIVHLAHSCIAVSGSVGLELLHHGKPSVVVYRVSALAVWVARRVTTCRFISLVNLLADREVFPEYLTARDDSSAIAVHVLRWLNDPAEYARLTGEMARLRERVGETGACRRAAEYITRTLASSARLAA